MVAGKAFESDRNLSSSLRSCSRTLSCREMNSCGLNLQISFQMALLKLRGKGYFRVMVSGTEVLRRMLDSMREEVA
jgi:hypothetical protein